MAKKGLNVSVKGGVVTTTGARTMAGRKQSPKVKGVNAKGTVYTRFK